jgi:hypothetical protein
VKSQGHPHMMHGRVQPCHANSRRKAFHAPPDMPKMCSRLQPPSIQCLHLITRQLFLFGELTHHNGHTPSLATQSRSTQPVTK